jgi:dienelactone hydrolase
MSGAAGADEPQVAAGDHRTSSNSFRSRLWTRFKSLKGSLARALTPSNAAWSAAAAGLYVVWALIFLSLAADMIGQFSIEQTVGLVILFVILAILSAVSYAFFWFVSALRSNYRWALLLSLPPTILIALFTWGPLGALVIACGVPLVLSLILGSAAALSRGDAPAPARVRAAAFLMLGSFGAAIAIYAFFAPAADPNPSLAHYHLVGQTLPMPDPGLPGPYKVTYFTYGGGRDRFRPEYSGRVRFITRPVDGSKFDENWRGPSGWLRARYWGFDSRAFPLQGRVWMPDTTRPDSPQGPFPLVLMVHGNHAMEAFSDGGYAYLGEHLASHGFIVVSVDENFLNSSLADFANPFVQRSGKENAARGWMLLEHLAQWRAWNADPNHPLFHKVDMDRIGLIGHSRGGEAVAIANAFNDLHYFPDDATVPFDFHFKIGAVAAIAPVDGQYKPRSRPIPMRDTNYFVMQGSMDGDLTSFMGSSQYSRAKFLGKPQTFKASLYIKDANHGQFNTAWGRYDAQLPFKAFLDTRPIMDAKAQRQIATVYLTAFLQDTLGGKDGYRPLFEDARNGAGWLPNVYLINNYADSDTRWLIDFKNLDPAVGSAPGVRISGQNLSIWRDSFIKLKSTPLDAYGVVLAWDDRVHKAQASYRIDLDTPVAGVTGGTSLVFGLSSAGMSSLPKDFRGAGRRSGGKHDEGQPIDWSIVLTDASGAEARLPLSHDQLLYPQIKGNVRRLAAIDSGRPSEIVVRRYRFRVSDFVLANPRLDPARLRSIRFEFDRTPRGAIVMTDVGLTDSL